MHSSARILFVTPEISDIVKVGGLGDVAAALPRALRRRHDVRIVVPGLREAVSRNGHIPIVGSLKGHAGIPPCEIGELQTADGLTIYVVICPSLYERRGNPYSDETGVDWVDNDIRFARLSLAAVDIAEGKADPRWRADLIHANDWPAAMAPAYAAWRGSRIPSVLTIHNLAYQGLFPQERLALLGAPPESFQIDGLEFYGKISFLKAGIFYASHITTVSQTYAREIVTPEGGCGLDGLLCKRAQRGELTAIVNGLDEAWDPQTDRQLICRFGPGDWERKGINTDYVRRRFGLAMERGPLFAVVSRLVHQKGIDIVLEAAETIVAAGGQIVITGKGESHFESALRELAVRHRTRVGLHIGFKEEEARIIFAGSDFLLMPSRFEPCGLSQMYAQRCGSLPVACKVGGLADTIEDGVTGLLFEKPSVPSFCSAIGRAFHVFASRQKLDDMRRAAMMRRWGWQGSATRYESVYLRALQTDGARSAAKLWHPREALL
jgi:starch synthase